MSESNTAVTTSAELAMELTAEEKARVIAYAKGIDMSAPLPEPPPEQKESKFKFFSYDEMLKLPPPRWQIKNVLVENSVTIVYGPSGHYKSFVVMAMAMSIATGIPWMGREIEEGTQGGVLYVAAEGFNGMPERMKAWVNYYKPATKPNIHYFDDSVNVQNESERNEFISSLVGMNIRLIVIDTLNMCFMGNENSPDDAGQFMKACKQVAKAVGCSIIVVHHTGKDVSKELRGSSAFSAGADSAFRVTKDADKHIEFHCYKQKEAEDKWDIPLAVLKSADSIVCVAGIRNEPVNAVSSEVQQKVLDALKQHPEGLGATKLFETARISKSSWNGKGGHCERMTAAGLIEQIGTKYVIKKDTTESK